MTLCVNAVFNTWFTEVKQLMSTGMKYFSFYFTEITQNAKVPK